MNPALSEDQKEIVEQPIHGSIQVLASAGSGKTRVLTERIRFILSNLKKDGVIALTFTNKAAAEMTERLTRGGYDEDRIWVGTIHSVAQRILEQYGHTIGLPSNVQIFERDKDRMEVFLEALRADGVDIDDYLAVDDPTEKKSRERNLQNYMDGFSIIKREILSEEDVSERFSEYADIWRVYNDYQSALLNSRGIDYDDILRYAHRILLEQTWIGDIYRAKYSHICVDEAQDLNRIQYEFVKVLAGNKDANIMMVGDPDQMIYGFNGSSSNYLCESFVTDFAPRVFRLTENYRSSKAVVRAANGLRPGAQKETEFALEGTVQLAAFSSEEEEASWIVSSIINLTELKTHLEIEGTISVDNMVVIARNRFVFAKLESVLGEHNIEYNVKVGEREKLPMSLFGQILDSALRVKLNPNDWVDGKKLCQRLGISAPSGWGNDDLLSQLRNDYLDGGGASNNLIGDLLTEVERLDFENPNILKFEKLFEKKLRELALVEPSEEERLEIDRSLVELQEFSDRWTRFRRLGLGNTLSAFRNATALGKLNPDATDAGLTLSTVHTMKGLEKDIVFLMGFCEGTFPDYRANTEVKINEERNTAFVAVTRARRWLFVSYPRSRMMPWGSARSQQPSRFIAEMGLT
ncbi:ATP-dependent helicase [Phaeobacter inhibens]|uniref:ATP-dependent helicase n=1 Tax=Phaeobacter inhibens TaxID=221822 RepID=UPI0021A3EF0E|nr:ATP-dependent helicase [Phaeobacter inhibens]UWR98040.1 ATP-dependent helicase [Phaeobacter inhibens]